ncbi:MAG: SDR family oxidoreductase, partial [Roseibium sp.]
MTTAIVTGAGTGIGAAAAKRLGQSGWNVALVGRRKTLLRDVAAAVEENGGHSIVIASDLSNSEVPERIVAETLDAFGTIDALINNAATIRVMLIGEFPPDILEEHWTTNLRAPFLLIQAALDALRKSRGAVV